MLPVCPIGTLVARLCDVEWAGVEASDQLCNVACRSANRGLLVGVSCQHSIMRAYMRGGQLSGQGGKHRCRTMSITWALL